MACGWLACGRGRQQSSWQVYIAGSMLPRWHGESAARATIGQHPHAGHMRAVVWGTGRAGPHMPEACTCARVPEAPGSLLASTLLNIATGADLSVQCGSAVHCSVVARPDASHACMHAWYGTMCKMLPWCLSAHVYRSTTACAIDSNRSSSYRRWLAARVSAGAAGELLADSRLPALRSTQAASLNALAALPMHGRLT